MSRGADRERQVMAWLVGEGWFCVRSAGSHGPADLVAARAGVVRLVQVKSNRAGPFAQFGPADRAELLDAAALAGAEAWLCWWPADRGGMRWLPPSAWPERARSAA